MELRRLVIVTWWVKTNGKRKMEEQFDLEVLEDVIDSAQEQVGIPIKRKGALRNENATGRIWGTDCSTSLCSCLTLVLTLYTDQSQMKVASAFRLQFSLSPCQRYEFLVNSLSCIAQQGMFLRTSSRMIHSWKVGVMIHHEGVLSVSLCALPP